MNSKAYDIEITHPGVMIQNRIILKKMVLTIKAGKLIGVVGPNGSAKTTFLKSISRMMDVQGLKIQSNQIQVHELSTRDSVEVLTYRSSHLISEFPLTAKDVLEMAYLAKALQPLEMDRLIQIFELDSLLGQNIQNMSSGEKQKLNFVQALLQGSAWTIFDESFSHMDLHWQAKAAAELKNQIREYQKAFIVVHHDLNWIRNHCDEVIAFKDGIIETYAPTATALHPDALRRLYPQSKIKESLQIRFI